MTIITIEIEYFQATIIGALIKDKMEELNRSSHPRHRANASLMRVVFHTLLKKALQEQLTRQKFKLRLKYHEAFILHQFILVFMEGSEFQDFYNDLRTVLGLLDEKLV